ncbi:cytochrome c maturation protein CcmE [Cereibacter azotoformans]|uniref:Cytochrome c-type biogenesis protein CcmE n=2 Tax=Cereibacter TaxID=1653176 RepID=CCME_CERS5|nr:cytochrome c maturation protein CcmE [Cereibacter azotoformans]A4WQY8.1 RecName: Full=Cytochrome c-type biogenesis protein CcmE; AltName: Full=Cytochrome c maturation protein E; AltName: Full=Heme chaperone CcmE [Cereibacter sphaeroides ATCC 17025]AXQ93022.1 cytochrome c maturation protein CcmE [Cereibacter sphaeroides]MBO4169287.1 cytochrome c maturation protein CcmE [Cereibacter azotoformans]PTR14612.1 cytochrome c-type biogenesis protein CcmE [Cereibacter azotoformans]UIJ31324.1 cytochro
MKGLKKKRRIQIITLAFVALAGSTALIGYAMRDGINFFRSPTQVVEAPPSETEVFRIGGLVEKGSLVRGQGETVTFRVTDTNATVPVRFTGVLPDLFAEDAGMVGTGRLVDGVFQASEILAKHDETYMPKEVVDALKEQGVFQHTEDQPQG